VLKTDLVMLVVSPYYLLPLLQIRSAVIAPLRCSFIRRRHECINFIQSRSLDSVVPTVVIVAMPGRTTLLSFFTTWAELPEYYLGRIA
jgi:hypothetical protein